jgi:shikimate kinase
VLTVPQIIVLGPPSSGKKVIGNMIAQKLGATYLTMDAMIQDADWQLKNAAIKLEQEGKVSKYRQKIYFV